VRRAVAAESGYSVELFLAIRTIETNAATAESAVTPQMSAMVQPTKESPWARHKYSAAAPNSPNGSSIGVAGNMATPTREKDEEETDQRQPDPLTSGLRLEVQHQEDHADETSSTAGREWRPS